MMKTDCGCTKCAEGDKIRKPRKELVCATLLDKGYD